MDERKADAPVKILFVDDEVNILRSIRRLLMEQPWEVLTAASGEEGVKVLESNRDVGLIVSDQRMPGLSGVDFLEKAKEMAPHAMRFMLTGYADIQATVDAINRGGAHRYISKPWSDDELVQVVRDGVHRYGLLAENLRLQGVVKRQNEELTLWNEQLKRRVLERTAEIRRRNEDLQRLNERLKEEFRSSIAAFSGLIELRDEEMRNHSRNVADLSERIAAEMGLPPLDADNVRIAAQLHDIGKIGIPDLLLRKDFADLRPDERDVYVLHPVRGQMAVDSIEDLREAGNIIRHHHERFDGAGFPEGRKGAGIPLGSRIIALADRLDRTIVKFTGDNALDLALREVRAEWGSLLDPALQEYIEKPAVEIYANRAPRTDMVELELRMDDLKQGMVLSRDVRSGTGVLLLGRRSCLDETNIRALRRYFELDPTREGIFVLLKR